jgi:ABC-type phosphate/phosphonate transport system substrate-binding protein
MVAQRRFMRLPLLLALAVALPLAGCMTSETDPVLRLAFTQPDDALEPAKHPERLAEAIEAATGRKTTIYFVQSTELALQAVDAGQADAAFVDGAAGWFAWQRFGLEAAAAHLESDGRPYYVASAWVRNESTYQSMEDLRGEDSCHTGLLKSAGTFMPLGWLIKEGLTSRVGPDEVASIQPTLDSYFGTVNMPPSDSDPYGNYAGALRCLSEGKGDVSFGKDTTPATFCGPAVANRASWCLDLGDYRELHQFGRVPSHPVMVGDLPADKREGLVQALVDLSATEDGKAILSSVLGTKGVVRVDSTEAHLGEFAATIEHVPGINAYVQGQVAK